MCYAKDDEEHQQKAKLIVDTVFEALDKDKDGKIALEEFEAAGLDALPSFENLGAEGHHYDVESGAYPTSLLLLTLSL
jgi:nucleobindin